MINQPLGNPIKNTIFISLASNHRDKISSLQQSVQVLKDKTDIEIIKSTSFYEVEPEDKNLLWYSCAVLMALTKLPPKKLNTQIKSCQELLISLNKDSDFQIELLFYEDLIYESDDFIIPHPKIQNKASILVPLLEIAPDYVHPYYNCTIHTLHNLLPNPEQVVLFGTNS